MDSGRDGAYVINASPSTASTNRTTSARNATTFDQLTTVGSAAYSAPSRATETVFFGIGCTVLIILLILVALQMKFCYDWLEKHRRPDPKVAIIGFGRGGYVLKAPRKSTSRKMLATMDEFDSLTPLTPNSLSIEQMFYRNPRHKRGWNHSGGSGFLPHGSTHRRADTSTRVQPAFDHSQQVFNTFQSGHQPIFGCPQSKGPFEQLDLIYVDKTSLTSCAEQRTDDDEDDGNRTVSFGNNEELLMLNPISNSRYEADTDSLTASDKRDTTSNTTTNRTITRDSSSMDSMKSSLSSPIDSSIGTSASTLESSTDSGEISDSFFLASDVDNGAVMRIYYGDSSVQQHARLRPFKDICCTEWNGGDTIEFMDRDAAGINQPCYMLHRIDEEPESEVDGSKVSMENVHLYSAIHS